MITCQDEQRKMIRNSQLKVIKFSKIAPDLNLDQSSSDHRDMEIHRKEAHTLFKPGQRRLTGFSINGSMSYRSRGSMREEEQVIPATAEITKGAFNYKLNIDTHKINTQGRRNSPVASTAKIAFGPGQRMSQINARNKRETTVNHDDEVMSTGREEKSKPMVENVIVSSRSLGAINGASQVSNSELR